MGGFIVVRRARNPKNKRRVALGMIFGFSDEGDAGHAFIRIGHFAKNNVKLVGGA